MQAGWAGGQAAQPGVDGHPLGSPAYASLQDASSQLPYQRTCKAGQDFAFQQGRPKHSAALVWVGVPRRAPRQLPVVPAESDVAPAQHLRGAAWGERGSVGAQVLWSLMHGRSCGGRACQAPPAAGTHGAGLARPAAHLVGCGLVKGRRVGQRLRKGAERGRHIGQPLRLDARQARHVGPLGGAHQLGVAHILCSVGGGRGRGEGTAGRFSPVAWVGQQGCCGPQPWHACAGTRSQGHAQHGRLHTTTSGAQPARAAAHPGRWRAAPRWGAGTRPPPRRPRHGTAPRGSACPARAAGVAALLCPGSWSVAGWGAAKPSMELGSAWLAGRRPQERTPALCRAIAPRPGPQPRFKGACVAAAPPAPPGCAGSRSSGCAAPPDPPSPQPAPCAAPQAREAAAAAAPRRQPGPQPPGWARPAPCRRRCLPPAAPAAPAASPACEPAACAAPPPPAGCGSVGSGGGRRPRPRRRPQRRTARAARCREARGGWVTQAARHACAHT